MSEQENKNQTFIVSDETKNDWGFYVRTAGINLEYFLQNPVMLYHHDPFEVPGKWENIRVLGSQLLMDAVFDMENPKAAERAGQVTRGFVKGASSTLEPVKFEMIIVDGKEQLWLMESILRETSITPMQSNKDCVKLVSSDGELLTQEKVVQLSSSLKPNNTIMTKTILIALGSALKIENATDELVIAAVQKLITDNEAAGAKIIELNSSVEEFNSRRVTDLIELATSAKKINTQAEKDNLKTLANANYDAAKALVDTMKPHVSLSSQIKNTPSADSLNEDRENWTFNDWNKKDAKGLVQLKSSNVAKYNKLIDDLRESLKSKGAIS